MARTKFDFDTALAQTVERIINKMGKHFTKAMKPVEKAKVIAEKQAAKLEARAAKKILAMEKKAAKLEDRVDALKNKIVALKDGKKTAKAVAPKGKPGRKPGRKSKADKLLELAAKPATKVIAKRRGRKKADTVTVTPGPLPEESAPLAETAEETTPTAASF